MREMRDRDKDREVISEGRSEGNEKYGTHSAACFLLYIRANIDIR